MATKYADSFDGIPSLKLSEKAQESDSSILQASKFAIIDASNRIKFLFAIAERGKTSVDWFYGFKLHLAINHRGELLPIALTTGNIDDRKPVKELLKGQHGKFFGDRGYISKALARDLRDSNVILVTKFTKNMNNRLMTLLGFATITQKSHR